MRTVIVCFFMLILVLLISPAFANNCPGIYRGVQTRCPCTNAIVQATACAHCAFDCPECSYQWPGYYCGTGPDGACYVSMAGTFCLGGDCKTSKPNATPKTHLGEPKIVAPQMLQETKN
jgi:hypothetical protein